MASHKIVCLLDLRIKGTSLFRITDTWPSPKQSCCIDSDLYSTDKATPLTSIASANTVLFLASSCRRAALLFHAERLPPASIHSRESLVTHKPVPKSKRGQVARRRRVYWTTEEEHYVVQGVKRFGLGKWKDILEAYPFKSCRTSVDIRDKWRNIK